VTEKLEENGMGCNCGRSSVRSFLVTSTDGGRWIVESDTAARMAVTENAGGGWIEVTPSRRAELVAGGVEVRG
jgi:hypothetical protein